MDAVPDALTIEAFGRNLRARTLTSRAVTEACLSRIAADNPRLNAFILVLADDARRQADEADRELAAGRDRGPLHGVPISLKDLIDLRGVPTTAASRVREGHIADRDAAVVDRLRQAGAVLIGKTNLHEFAFGTTNEDSAFGPAKNPYDVSRSPGGSSGGSAVAVASGMSLGTIGTDTGGSIRIPAAACGIVGLKATFGEVSTEGVVPLARSLDHVGPLARTVTDAWLIYRALIDSNESALPAATPVQTLRLAVLRRHFCDLLDQDVRSRFEQGVASLRAAGAQIDEVGVPHADEIPGIYTALSLPEAAEYHAATLDSMPERYTKAVRARLELGRYVLAEDYVRALKGREVLCREVDAALADRDGLLLPTLPIPAPILGNDTVDIDGAPRQVRPLMLRQTQLFNLSRHPAISLPCGRTREGLPCGIQIVGARMRTDALARAALACERVFNQ